MLAVMNCVLPFQGLLHSNWIPSMEEKEEVEKALADL
jgi:hypothetical protein